MLLHLGRASDKTFKAIGMVKLGRRRRPQVYY